MRKFVTLTMFSLATLLVVAFSLYNDTPPGNPPGFTALSPPVNLNFKITQINEDKIEMALTNPGGQIPKKDALYATFRVVSVSGKRVVALEEFSTRSTLKAPTEGKKRPDLPFLSDARGREVMSFNFEHQLTEGPGGETLMRMRYTGVPVPLIEELIIDKTVTVPAFLQGRFGSKKTLKFGKGTYKFDNSIDGFWIRVPQ